jgi:hypothetical protein
MPLVPGRHNQYNVGLTQAIGKRVTVDAEYFWKFTHGAYDFNVILNTPLNFPIQFDKAKIDGATARVSLAPSHGFSAFTVMGHKRSRLFTPEIGGINFGTQYAPVARPDHDQASQQTTFVHYQPAPQAPWLGFTWRFDGGLVVVSVPDRATALTLTGDEQSQMGLYCGPAIAAVARPVRACASPNFGATRVHIVSNGSYDPDRNPSRIVPRNRFDVAAGLNDIWHSEPYHLDAKLTAINLTDKVALYNFLSGFSGSTSSRRGQFKRNSSCASSKHASRLHAAPSMILAEPGNAAAAGCRSEVFGSGVVEAIRKFWSAIELACSSLSKTHTRQAGSFLAR